MIRLHRGAAAATLVADEPFRSAWSALAAACPYSTCFQAPPFVTTWYRCYASRFEPVIVEERAGEGSITGLLLLAREIGTGTLVPAGREQAEYHAWLALPGRETAFFEAALDRLAAEWPAGRLQFLFAPPGLPLEPSPRWRGRIVRRPIARPLMATGPEAPLAESLKKSANRSRLNRLKKLGTLTVDRLTTADELAAALDEIVPFYELRQGAAHGALPFRTDPGKRAFLIAQMAEPGLVHATVLRLDGRIIAAHIGPCNGRQVVLGLIAHSPVYSRYSAGKLLLRLLGLRLQEEGFTHLDLTPGGEYKDRFASGQDEASVLDVWFRRTDARVYRAQRAAIDAGKRFVSTDRVKEQLAYLRHKASRIHPAELPGKFVRLARLAAAGRPSLRVYRTEASAVRTAGVARVFNRDALLDLTLYDPVELWQALPTAFLRAAMTRIEQGEHVYTLVRDGRLAAYGWLAEQQTALRLPELRQTLTLPEGSSVIDACYTDPRYRGQGLIGALIRQALADAAGMPGTRAIYMTGFSHNRVWCRSVERAGLQLDRTIVASDSPLRAAWSTIARAARLAVPFLLPEDDPGEPAAPDISAPVPAGAGRPPAS